jgi:hypothetical protein
MLPPEALPRAKFDDAEIVICRGSARCESLACPCQFCLRIATTDKRSLDEILESLLRTN